MIMVSHQFIVQMEALSTGLHIVGIPTEKKRGSKQGRSVSVLGMLHAQSNTK